MSYSLDEIKNEIEISLTNLIERDSYLLKENVNERSITYKFANYLQKRFKDYDVDCEYNRVNNGSFITKKSINYGNNTVSIDDKDATTVFPDIIVHKRNKKKNLLIIEAKKSNNRNLELDHKKLEIFTDNNQFNYSFGLNVIFQVKDDFGKPIILKWYKEGEFDHETEYSL